MVDVEFDFPPTSTRILISFHVQPSMAKRIEQQQHKFVKPIASQSHQQTIIIMINTKVLVAVLAVVACASADGTTKIRRKRALRHRAGVSAAAATNDLTEDVAFWTRSLQASLPPVPPPTEGG